MVKIAWLWSKRVFWLSLPVVFVAQVAAQSPTINWKTVSYGSGFTETLLGDGQVERSKNALAVDSAGNIYMVGASFNGVTNEFLTIKFNAYGVEQWRATPYITAMTNAFAKAVAVDAMGNVYVTGSGAFDLKRSFVTIKYNANGVEQWRTVPPTPLIDGSGAEAIALDAAGNVYVSGGSIPFFSGTLGYLTIKYDANGAEQWKVTTANAPGRNTNFSAMALDSAGNVYITGNDPNPARKWVTVKISSAGVELWRTFFTDPTNRVGPPSSLAVDPNGNAFIAAYINDGSSEDFLTVKYGNDGAELWRRSAGSTTADNERANAVKIDADGNAVVTGFSSEGGKYSLLTLKYTPDGTEIWRTRAFATSGFGVANSIAIDAAGNIFIAGEGGYSSYFYQQFIAAKIAPNGTLLWQVATSDSSNSLDSAYSVVVGPSGNVVVAGTRIINSMRDMFAITFDPGGSEVARAKGGMRSGIATSATSMKVAGDGNVYVLGGVRLNNTIDPLLMKLSGTGTELWRVTANNFFDRYTTLPALALDPQGNILVAGTATDASFKKDFLTIKYNSAGAELWRARADGSAGANDGATAIAVDNGGNVYVTGTYTSVTSSSGIMTLKYDPSGQEVWRAVAGETTTTYPAGLAVNTTGEAYVVGAQSGLLGGFGDFITIKYGATGQEIWRRTFNGAAMRDDAAIGVGLDAAGNVYVFGSSVNASNNIDALVIKYDSGGTEQWRRVVPNGANGGSVMSMTVDPNGNVYVSCGIFTGGVSSSTTTKIAASGLLIWQSIKTGTPGNGYAPKYVQVDAQGSVYVAGSLVTQSGKPGFVAIKYAPNGKELWELVGSAPNNAMDVASIVRGDADGSLYLFGTSTGGGASAAMTVARFTQNDAAPILRSAIPGDGKAFLIFSPPAFTGGSPVTGYAATCGPGNISVPGPTSPIVVNGLTNGVSYVCTVTVFTANGSTASSGSLNVLPSADPPLTLISAVSRKFHGATSFDLPIDTSQTLGGPITVEPRAIGMGHLLVFEFNRDVTALGAVTALDSTGTGIGNAIPMRNGSTVSVSLAGIEDIRSATITLNGLNGTFTQTAALGFLLGDVNGSRSVNASDISGIKARAGQVTNKSNFRFDLDASGAIGITDISAVKGQAGSVLN